jgi:aminopeptidase
VTHERIARWADLLVDYCLQVGPGETVVIASEWEARRLVEACYRAVVLRGGHPLVRIDLPGLSEFFLRHASDSQLAHVPPVGLYEAETADARIRIAAESDTRELAGIDPGRQVALDRARDPIRRAAGRKRWVLTQYPTAAYAAGAGMDLGDYEDFVARAMFLDEPDSAAAWSELGQRQARLVSFMSAVETIRIEAEGTDLTLSVAGRTWINSDGRRNMPSGEIFSGPIEDSARGRIRCAQRVSRGGRELSGIELEFAGGAVVAAHAEEGEPYLRSMLELDPGARRLGEIGLGLNPGIDRFTGTILYDEKIGGTVHLALGRSYPETGGTNESALHWDLIIDTRLGGRLTADGRVVMDDGRWRVG